MGASYPRNKIIVIESEIGEPVVAGFVDDLKGKQLAVKFEVDGSINISSDGEEPIRITKHTARMIANLSDAAGHVWIELQRYRSIDGWADWEEMAFRPVDAAQR